MYINRGALLKFVLLGKRVFNFLKKHFYILVIIEILSKFSNNKFYKIIAWLIKVFIFINIIFSVGYILYFTVLGHSFYNGFSVYKDLISNYIDQLISLWNEVTNIDVEQSFIKKTVSKDDLNLQIKEGIKEALREVVDESLDKMHEAEVNNNFYKNIV